MDQTKNCTFSLFFIKFRLRTLQFSFAPLSKVSETTNTNLIPQVGFGEGCVYAKPYSPTL